MGWTDDEVPVSMQQGQCGLIQRIDRDGDALILFDGSEGANWICRRQFYHSLSLLQASESRRRFGVYIGDSRVFQCAACGTRGHYCDMCVMEFGPSVANSFATMRHAPFERSERSDEDDEDEDEDEDEDVNADDVEN